MLNKIRGVLVVVISLGLFVTACSTSRKLAKNNVTLEEMSVTSKDMEYRATADIAWDITHTKVALGFNWKEKTADGIAQVRLHPYFYATDSVVLDAKSMRVDSVLLFDANRKYLPTYTYADDKLNIRLNKTYTADDTIELYIRYTAMPYGKPTGGSKAITDDRGLYFINTDYAIPGKPAQIWTQGETEANSHWMPVIDKPNQRFTTELQLSVPDSFTTLSNGTSKSKSAVTNGMRTDTWVMDKPIQAYAVMFAIGKFSIIKDEWKNKEVSYYVEPEYAPYARTMFRHTKEMMEYYSAITGVPYPWNKYSQVVVRDYVSGAMENTTASLFGEFMNQNLSENVDHPYEDIVAHELFHQWFGDYVTAESWSNITLNESFANYGEVLWRRHQYGNNSADEFATQQLWSYLYGQSQSNDPALVRFHYRDKEDVFDRISYQKGGAILGYLHGLIGDSAFYKSMNVYLTANALQSAEATQWRLAVEKVTGKDWNWFFNQWYYRGGHPILDMKYDYDDIAKQVTVTVTQKQKELYQLPLQSWVINGAAVTAVHWDIVKRKETFVYPYKDAIRPVIFADAKHWLVGELNYNLQPSQWLQIYKLSDDNIVNKHLAVSQGRKKIEDSSGMQIIKHALNDKQYSIRQLALENISMLKGEQWKIKFRDKVIDLAQNDSSNDVRATAFALLELWKEKESTNLMLAAVNDSSYLVAGAALNAYYIAETNKDTVYAIAKHLLTRQPKGNLRAAVWNVIADSGNAADITLFEQYAWTFYGTHRIFFAQSLSSYLQHVDSISAFNKAVDVFISVIKSENISSYRSGIVSYFFEAAAVINKKAEGGSSKGEHQLLQQKADKLKAATDIIIKEEAYEDNLKQYKNYRKIIFGNQ